MSLQSKPKTFVGALRDTYPPVAPADPHLRGLMALPPCEIALDTSIFEPGHGRDHREQLSLAEMVRTSPTGLGLWRF